MHRARVTAAAFVLVAAVSACSSSGRKSPPATSTGASTSSSAALTTTSGSVSTSTLAATTTLEATSTTAPATRTVRIDKFAVQPTSVQCNAPSMVELSWSVRGATTVTLALDGGQLATFGAGAHSGLYPIPCDGKPHRYLLTATAGSEHVTSTLTVPTKQT